MKTLSVADTAGARNNLTLIRLLAAVSVIYGHSYPILGRPDPTALFFQPQSHYIGDIAVDVFFVVSGFLLARSASLGTGVAQFVKNRVLRIYPALIVCNIVVVLLAWALLSRFDPGFLTDSLTLRYLVTNSLMLHENLAASMEALKLPSGFTGLSLTAMNGSLWTLPAEIKAYAYMVAIMILCQALPRRLRVVQPAFWWGMLLALLLVFPQLPLVGGELLYRRLMLFFFAGACLYSVRRWVPLDWRIAVIGCLAVVLLRGQDPLAFKTVTLLVYPYVTLFAAFGLPYWKTVNESGDFSYGVYIYGWFSQSLVASADPTMDPRLVFALGTLLALAFAVPSWFLVEKPALKAKNFRWSRFLPPGGRSAPLAAASMAAERDRV